MVGGVHVLMCFLRASLLGIGGIGAYGVNAGEKFNSLEKFEYRVSWISPLVGVMLASTGVMGRKTYWRAILLYCS